MGFQMDLEPFPSCILEYSRKLKKFFNQWHASLVKKGISEHLAYKLAKRYIQASDEEGDLETDSHNVHRVEKPRFPPGILLKGTQLFQASTQVLPHMLNNHGGDNKDISIPSQPSANPVPTQVPQTDDEPVMIRLSAGARAPRQRLGGDNKPVTLVEALQAKNRLINHLEEGHKAFDTLAVAQKLQERDFKGRLSSQDICVIGLAVLHKVFGDRGQNDALTHLYGRHPRRHLANLDQNAGRVADKIRQGGQATLSSFTLHWAQAVQHDSPSMLTIDDIRLIDIKVSLVHKWDRWSNPAATASNKDIKDFLVKNGIDTNAGLALSTRIAKYLSRKLGLPEGTLAKKIYAWQLLAVMADVFSASIYIFVSRSLFTCYNKIRPTNSIKKEDKFRTMALAVADEIPDLLGICEASYAHIVQPVLEFLLTGNNIQDLSRDLRVPGVQMATDGDIHSLRKISIPELLGVCISPRGFVEELDSVTEDNAEAKTTLVRQQSIVRRHHNENGKDSTGDEDNNDNESREEDNENYS
ncbi:hypothetical protein BFJ72_g14791 [Fusarium proliferatum]|uniref:Uncharacterized protein n=1 Tax=Gibberella intermedia TaxID=948311 RepID=A0A420RYF5_GIBIN|nr:hypothetical protein FPRO03_14021 [Fusarium proliferatum]RKL22027.1 hypothetical protein BFJ72_g14791 [Fusarium proliferatum]